MLKVPIWMGLMVSLSSFALTKKLQRPAWIREDQPFLISQGWVNALGKTTTPPGAGFEEGYIIAANSARENACKAMEHRLDRVFQDSEEGSSVDHRVLKAMATDLCKWFNLHSRRGERYWEKVATTAASGDRIEIYRAFVTEKVREQELKNTVIRLVRVQEKKRKIAKGYSKRIQNRWGEFAQSN